MISGVRSVHALQTSAQFLYGTNGDQLDTPPIGHSLNLLPGSNSKFLANGLRDHDLELAGNGYCLNGESPRTTVNVSKPITFGKQTEMAAIVSK